MFVPNSTVRTYTIYGTLLYPLVLFKIYFQCVDPDLGWCPESESRKANMENKERSCCSRALLLA
jgi:hypothetical protein